MRPAELAPVDGDAGTSSFRLAEAVAVDFQTGFRRTLKPGTHWKRIGTLPEGDVFEPTDTVFTVEGRHVREAYLVVDEGILVGFFLPVEDAFVPLANPISIHISE